MNTNNKLYEKEISMIRQELKTLPDGYLVKRGSYYYEKAGDVQKGITKDPQKVGQLARKAYLLKRLRHIEWNFSVVKKQSQRLKTENPTEIIRGLPSFYHTLPVHYYFHPSVKDQLTNGDIRNAADRNFAGGHNADRRNAANEHAVDGNAAKGRAVDGNVAYGRIAEGHDAARKTNYQSGLIYLTNSGIRVRSKSERIIADTLYQYGVTFSYEAAIALGSVAWSPDFTVYKPFDGKVFIWEHFGLMDDDEYRLNTNKKLAFYAKYDFLPFKNLICTYEEDISNPARIQGIIETFLLG